MNENRRPGRPEYIGRYRVIDRIGKGAMGVVYSAHDDVMERDVAVKVMMTDFEGDQDLSSRFKREAQVSAKLSHRNIVTVFDVGDDDGRLYIVMELLQGMTLGDCLQQRTLSIEQKVAFTLDVCAGLTVASAAGICHRDIKPGNLFLQDDGGVKILDFGIARHMSSSMTASGLIIGTPDYMSPEQARGDEVDTRSDIFSVGAVLYLMLTGRKPFDAPSLPAVLQKVVSNEPPPIDPAQAPAALARIVFKALVKAPDQRYQTFQELSGDLDRWRRHYEVETRMLAGEAARTLGSLQSLAADERQAAEALGVPAESNLEAALIDVSAGYPELMANGAEALRAGPWQRGAVDEIARRIAAVRSAWEPRVSALRAAGQNLAAATRQMESGDARAALVSLDAVRQQVPAAGIAAIVERAERAVAEQQAREDKLRSLLGEAVDARQDGRLEAALVLVTEALQVDPQHSEARQLLSGVQADLANAEADRIRRCDRALERARRALQLEQFDEAAHHLDLAKQTGAAHSGIASLEATLSDARAARDNADAMIQEITTEVAQARSEFREANPAAAIERLENLAARHPSSVAARTELGRLRAEHQRVTEAEQTAANAGRLAAEAARALASGDAPAATLLAEQALALVPSHELALKTSALAHAHARELAERRVREEKARRLVASARALLDRGRFDRAIKEARRAAELDPAGLDAPAVIAESFRRQAEAARLEGLEKEAARRNADVREALAGAATALRARDFVRARGLAERAAALDPDNTGPRELVARIAAAAALAEKSLEDETVDLHKGAVDPDATAVLAPAGDHWMRRIPLAVRLLVGGMWVAVLTWARARRAGRSQPPAGEGRGPQTDPGSVRRDSNTGSAEAPGNEPHDKEP